MTILDILWLLDRTIAFFEAQRAIIPGASKSLKDERACNSAIRDGTKQWRECNELLSQLRDFRRDVSLDGDERDEERRKRH